MANFLVSYIVSDGEIDPTKAIRDVKTGHPLLQERWLTLHPALEKEFGKVLVIEVFRYDKRQQWLYGQGRTKSQLKTAGIPTEYARSGSIVTNAKTARYSAHGVVMYTDADSSRVLPASAAIDVVPLGEDGKPWTKDDPWTRFVEFVNDQKEVFGLRHFNKPGKAVWDKPHLQLLEWSDKDHRLLLPISDEEIKKTQP